MTARPLKSIADYQPKMAESTAFGAACLAGLGHGIYRSLQDIAGLWEGDVRCEPKLDPRARKQEMAGWREAYYGTNYPRLARIKATYDPDQMFRFPQGITPA